MGAGLPSGIAASIVNPNCKVVVISGDALTFAFVMNNMFYYNSAFYTSQMEQGDL